MMEDTSVEKGDKPQEQLFIQFQDDQTLSFSKMNSTDAGKSGKRCREEKLMDCVSEIMNKLLPPSVAVDTDAEDVLVECVKSFISAVSCEGGSNSLNENREAINGRDILIALGQMGWEDFHQPLSIYYQKLQSQRLVEASKPFTPNPEFPSSRSRPLYEEAVSGLYCKSISTANLQFSSKKKVAATSKRTKNDALPVGNGSLNGTAYISMPVLAVTDRSQQQGLQKVPITNKQSSITSISNSSILSYNLVPCSGSINTLAQKAAENSSRCLTNGNPTSNAAYSGGTDGGDEKNKLNSNYTKSKSSSGSKLSNTRIGTGPTSDQEVNRSSTSVKLRHFPPPQSLNSSAFAPPSFPDRSNSDYHPNQGSTSRGGMYLHPPQSPMLLSSPKLSTMDLLAFQSVVATASQVQHTQQLSMQHQLDPRSTSQSFGQLYSSSSTSSIPVVFPPSSSSSNPPSRHSVAYPNILYPSNHNHSSNNIGVPARNVRSSIVVDQKTKLLPPKVVSNNKSFERFTTYREALVEHLESVLINNRQRSPFLTLGTHPIPTLKDRYLRSVTQFVLQRIYFFV